ncbi:MAG: LemA family protein [Bacteroidetes bacterium]|nr:LemA family protein [Bacteroidota bacterium]
MNKTLIVVLAILGVIVLGGIGFFRWGAGVYDRAVSLDEDSKKAWSNVQSAYQRRADLVPELVATVKASAENEKTILTQVTQARAGIVGAKTPEDLTLAGKKINTAINLAFEAYPEIRSTANFATLQSQLEGTENRIKVERDNYNAAVAEYNKHIRGFFKRWALSMFSDGEFQMKQGFEAVSENADQAPDVNKMFKE